MRNDTGDLISRKALREVEMAPSVDAAPVVHGRWIHDYNNRYGCSECAARETMSHRRMKKFCPNCGAKMDGGNDNGTD